MFCVVFPRFLWKCPRQGLRWQIRGQAVKREMERQGARDRSTSDRSTRLWLVWNIALITFNGYGTWWNMVNKGIGQLFGSIGHNIWNNTWLWWLSIPYGSSRTFLRSGQGVWLMGLSTFSDSVWDMAFMTFHTLWIQPYLLRKWPRGMMMGLSTFSDSVWNMAFMTFHGYGTW